MSRIDYPANLPYIGEAFLSSKGNRWAAVVLPRQHSAAHSTLLYGKKEGQRFHVIMYCPALSLSADSAKNYELRVRMGSCY